MVALPVTVPPVPPVLLPPAVQVALAPHSPVLHDLLLWRAACALRREGAEPDEMQPLLEQANQMGRDPKPPQAIDKLVARACAYPPHPQAALWRRRGQAAAERLAGHARRGEPVPVVPVVPGGLSIPERPDQGQGLTEHYRETVAQFLRAQSASRHGLGPQVDPRQVLLVRGAPGTGKSTAVAALGETFRLAWIAERHDQYAQIATLAAAGFAHIQPATAANCPHHQTHDDLGRLGYNSRAAHQQGCPYCGQFHQEGSTFYMRQHMPTPFPAEQEDGTILDELDLAAWLPERPVTISLIQQALRPFAVGGAADRLLRAVQAVISAAHAANTPLAGRAVFEALDTHFTGELRPLLSDLARNPNATRPRPWPPATIPAALLAPVVLPHVWHGLMGEMVAWQQARSLGPTATWNSLLRVGPPADGQTGAWVLGVTQPLQPGHDGEGNDLPPRVVLDATADPALLGLLFDAEVLVQQVDVPPPPHTQHVAVRTGARYGKTALCGGYGPKHLQRATAQVRTLLQQVDPSGTERAAGRVGLITFAGCEQAMREALGLPDGNSLHFWAARGSNALEGCTILLIVGTPTLRPEETLRLARALWRRDPHPIDPACTKETDGYHWADPRVQHLADHLTNSELTQCAHRSRALRYDGRIVISLCQGKIDYLPVTDARAKLPQLGADGTPRADTTKRERDRRLQDAAWHLVKAGQPLSRRALARRAGVNTNYTGDWLRLHRADYPPGPPVPGQPPDGAAASSSGTGLGIHISYSLSGTTENPGLAPPPDGTPVARSPAEGDPLPLAGSSPGVSPPPGGASLRSWTHPAPPHPLPSPSDAVQGGSGDPCQPGEPVDWRRAWEAADRMGPWQGDAASRREWEKLLRATGVR